jgi:adenylosuccinate lyase
MPQKRNPWNSEHVKSLWKAFSPRVMSFYLDQISEHQRDLTNSASSRFISEYLAGFAASVGRMNKIIPALFVDRDRLLHNLRSGGDLVLAEAAYILLAESGEPDAHEKIRKCTLNCEKNKTTLREELKKDSASWETLSSRLAKSLDVSPEEFFSRPELYRGRSAEKAKKIAEKYSLLEKKISEALNEH